MAPEETEKKVLAHEVYAQIHKELKLNPRTIQWYATEGYIPKPEKIGAEAYYAPSAQIMSRVRVIQTMQKRYDIKLKDIKEIIQKQAKEDWEDVQNLLAALEDLFPYSEIDYNGNECVNDTGVAMARRVCEALRTKCVNEIELGELQEQYLAESAEAQALSEFF